MHFKIQRLRSNGAKLSAEKLGEPVLCDLRIGDLTHVRREKSCRAAQAFALEVYGTGIRREVFPPLLEPRIGEVEPGHIIITGSEHGHVDGVAVLYGQAWKCMPP